ncbi:MAG TPA: hypothetical protein VMS93_05300 [Candidatus Saccharimonadales bacterium]|nr:hypothetical protein [Candidatus Saccharimonadales bacterium]
MMRRTRTLCAAALAAAGLLAAFPAAAQVAVESADLSPRQNPFNPWFVYRSVTVKDSLGAKTKYTQLSVPVSLKARLGQNLSVVMFGAFARTEVQPDSAGAASNSLSGLTDVRAKLFYHTGGTVISAGVSLPTGKHSLTSQEDVLAAVAATDVFGFRVRRLGEGFDTEVGVTHALEAGQSGALALGVAYLYKASYKPLEGSESTYRPGSELSASAGYDYSSPTTLLRLNATGRIFTKDQADGVPAFKQGATVVLEERWVARSAGRLSNDLSLVQVIKGSSDYYGGPGGAVLSGSAENGSSVGGAERLELEMSRGMRLALLADGTFYGKNATGFDSAHLLGFGGELALEPSSRALLRVMGKVLTGSADPGSVKLSGFDVGVSLRVLI